MVTKIYRFQELKIRARALIFALKFINKLKPFKNTYEQILSRQAEQVNGKSDNMDKIKEFKGFEALYSLKNTQKSINVG